MEFWAFQLVALALRVGRVGKTKAHPVALGCVGVAGVLGFGSLRWNEGWKRSKPKAQPLRVGALLKHLKFLKFLLH